MLFRSFDSDGDRSRWIVLPESHDDGFQAAQSSGEPVEYLLPYSDGSPGETIQQNDTTGKVIGDGLI